MDNRTAVITGAGRGMGQSIACALAELGAQVVVNDLDEEAAQGTVQQIRASRHRAAAFQTDVTDAPGVQAMVDWTADTFGGVHILVNTAGVLYPTSVAETDEEEWDRVIAVNLKGTFLCSKAVLSHMQDAGWGRIINISSTAGKSVSTVGGAHYTASKAGVLGFTRHLAREVASDGITVNAVCPGLIDTEMVRTAIDKERTRAYAESFPIQRLGKPEEVAELVAFLASAAAGFITGQTLSVSGGYTRQ